MPKRLSTLSVSLASFFFTYLFFAEYLPPYRRVYIPYDLWGYHYPLADYAFQSLKHLRFPAWDVSIYCGQPFAANLQAALFYPPIWILFAASALHGVLTYAALEAFQFAHIWLAFLLFFCWLRSKGLADLASLLGAGVFAYSGYAMLQLQHLGLLCGYAWLPLGLWGIDEIASRRSWPGFLKIATASALCFLAGYPPTWLVFAIYLSVYALFSRVPLIALLALVGSLALAAIQLLPALDASSLMLKENRYGTGFQDPAFYLSYLIPNFFDFGITTPPMTNFGKEYLYLGAPGLFGIAALLLYKRWRPAIPTLAAGLVCLVFLSNPFHLVSAIIDKIGFFSQICRDWYFLTGITAMAATLAAFGIDRFLAAAPVRLSKAWAIAGILCAAGWAAYELHAWRPRAPSFPAGWSSALDALIILVVFAILMFAIRGQSGRWSAILTVILLLSAGIDYKALGTSKRFNGHRAFFLPHDYAKNGFNFMDPSAFHELTAHPEYRILLDFGAPAPVELRHHNLSTPQGFDPFIAQRYLDFIKGLGGEFQNNREFTLSISNDFALQSLAVRYVITTPNGPLYPALTSNPAFRLVGDGKQYFRVYEYQKYSEPYSGAGQITPLHRTPETRQFQINSPEPFEFVLKEQFFPGWTASLDGNPIPIQLWRGALQSVRVPAGLHSLSFSYHSHSQTVGAWISALSILLLVATAILRRSLVPRV